jgi:hypothetical protein
MEIKAMTTAIKKLFSACRLWIPLSALALIVTAFTWPRTGAIEISGPAVLGRAVVARVTDIPSHNRLYRASLVLTNDSSWTLQLRSVTGAPIPNAAVAMDAWMPDAEQHAHVVPTASEYQGAGAYRVRRLAFDRTGWWNVRVQMSAAGRTDSLAFNLVLR